MELTQSEKLELSAILGGGTLDDMDEPAPAWQPRIPQPSRAMAELTSRHGPRRGGRGFRAAPRLETVREYEQDEGGTAPLAIVETADYMPSIRSRSDVRAHLRGMGYQGEGW